MEIGYRVVGCGLFDSKVCFPSTGLTPDRRLDGFEIELFYEDQPGMAFIDNTPYKMKKGDRHMRKARAAAPQPAAV